jgi:hypothetical protein
MCAELEYKNCFETFKFCVALKEIQDAVGQVLPLSSILYFDIRDTIWRGLVPWIGSTFEPLFIIRRKRGFWSLDLLYGFF